MKYSPENRSLDIKSLPRSMSLRARLVTANILIVILAIVATGTYVYAKLQQQTNAFNSQMTMTMSMEGQDRVSATANDQGAQLNNYFTQENNTMLRVVAQANSLISNESHLSNGNYWDALTSLSRLPNGSWHNSTSDPASVFIPAKDTLTPDLAAELNTLKGMDFSVPWTLKTDP